MGDYAWQSAYTSQPNVLEYKDDTRNFKGYWFEIMVCKRELASIPNIRYNCNPSAYNDWLQNHSKNSFDAVVTYSNGTSENLEMKSVSDGVKIQSSWFRRDWLTRDAKIIVTNNPTAISYRDKRIAEKLGKKILSVSEAKVYISNKIYKILHPNQLSSWNSLITNIINNILEFSSKINSKIVKLGFKIRFKNCLSGLKSSVKARFSKSQFKLHLPLCLNAKLSIILCGHQLSQDTILCQETLNDFRQESLTKNHLSKLNLII